MSTTEHMDQAKVRDSAIVICRLNHQYPTHAWKEEQAKRLHYFLNKRESFTRNQLRNWLYRELYLYNPRRRESPFIKKVLNLILDELTFKNYIEHKNEKYKVLLKPNLDECLRILRMQWLDYYL